MYLSSVVLMGVSSKVHMMFGRGSPSLTVHMNTLSCPRNVLASSGGGSMTGRTGEGEERREGEEWREGKEWREGGRGL